MKKLYIVLATALLLPQIGTAQNFSFVEGDLIEKDIITEEFETADSKILNSSDEAVIFEWEQVTFENPFGWEFSLCDYPNCYTDGETSGTMAEVAAGSELAFLKVNVYASSAGVGTYSYAVWDQAFPDDRDTITFILTASGPSGIEELSKDKIGVTTTSQNQITLSNTSDEPAGFSLINISGKTIFSGTVAPNDLTIISTAEYDTGLYFVAFLNGSEIIETEKVIIR